jgi:hypothetical protein
MSDDRRDTTARQAPSSNERGHQGLSIARPPAGTCKCFGESPAAAAPCASSILTRIILFFQGEREHQEQNFVEGDSPTVPSTSHRSPVAVLQRRYDSRRTIYSVPAKLFFLVHARSDVRILLSGTSDKPEIAVRVYSPPSGLIDGTTNSYIDELICPRPGISNP